MKVVIIGSGPAGIVAAEATARGGPDRRARDDHPGAPSAVLAAGHGRSLPDRPLEPLFWKGRDVTDRLGIAYRSPARVVAVDPERRQVSVEETDPIGYDALLIASGSRLHAPIDGAELPGVHDFKSLVAAESIMARVRRHEVTSALIVGAGFIGMEIALLLADLGVRVTIVGRRTWVMPRMLDPETAEIAGRAMVARSIELRLGVEAAGFVERDGVASGVRLADGTTMTADLYVAATGVKPNLAFLEHSGVATDWGIAVDDRLRTNVPHVWAAGDVVEAKDRATGKAFVHAIFPNAVDQARVVAANILGGDVVYPGAESMNSLKHLGLPIMAVGAMEGPDELRWRRGDDLRKVFLDEGRVVGFRFAGEISGGGLLRSLLLRGDDVRRFGSRLVTPGFGIGEVVLPAMSI